MTSKKKESFFFEQKMSARKNAALEQYFEEVRQDISDGKITTREVKNSYNKAKRKSDPDAEDKPKRPLTDYQRFFKEQMAKLPANMEPAEKARLIGVMWGKEKAKLAEPPAKRARTRSSNK
jgi:hypothetical protein